jgi:crossover junction endodeoxyribonuclease RusA
MTDDGYQRLKAAGLVKEGRTVGEALARVAEQEAAPRVAEGATYVLPWPPSVNEYLRFGILPAGKGKRPYLTPGGKLCDGYIKPFHTQKSVEFRKAAVAAIGFVKPMFGSLAAEIIAYPPSRHRRDLDNLLKCTLDALQHAGALLDDTQIRRLSISWGPRKSGGAIEVRLTTMPEATGLFEDR